MNKVWIILTVMLLGACQTVDVFFPQESANKAADRIISEVWQPVGKPASKELK